MWTKTHLKRSATQVRGRAGGSTTCLQTSTRTRTTPELPAHRSTNTWTRTKGAKWTRGGGIRQGCGQTPALQGGDQGGHEGSQEGRQDHPQHDPQPDNPGAPYLEGRTKYSFSLIIDDLLPRGPNSTRQLKGLTPEAPATCSSDYTR